MPRLNIISERPAEIIENGDGYLETLRENQRFLSTLISNLPGYVYRCHSESGVWVTRFASDGIYELTGYRASDFLEGGKIAYGWLVHPDDKVQASKIITHALDNQLPYQISYRIKTKSEEIKWVWEQGRGIYDEKGTIKATEGFITDITEKKVIEEEILKRNEELSASLEQKEILLQEIHHRVKNNLQIMSSLLRLQSSHLNNEDTKQLFLESENRIKSMAIIHSKLYNSSDFENIDFSDYVRTLVTNLTSTYGVRPDTTAIKIGINGIRLNIETAIPCGLIINELVSNCLKYAFPGNRKGQVEINMRSDVSNNYELVVSDNGVGLPGNLDIKSSGSLGMKLVSLLTGQLGGSIDIRNHQGTEFKIRFAEIKYRERTTKMG